ncbi:MAG: hypothetical protein KME31_26585 [Tolypothrix carrinoi HA7290-LM1]|nr:hypothetical protein [Tolypothrix carrinoi HA7290-LM1]
MPNAQCPLPNDGFLRVCRETLAAVAHGGNPQDRAADAYALPPQCPMTADAPLGEPPRCGGSPR